MPSQTSVFQQCGTLSCPDFPPQAEACSDRINYCKIYKNYAKIVNFADIISKAWPSHPPSDLQNFKYVLPESRIARYPLPDRSASKLLLYKEGKISHDSFSALPGHLPVDSCLVFNNTRVIQARLRFRKETGARIEIFCLEPKDPADYELAFQARNPPPGTAW